MTKNRSTGLIALILGAAVAVGAYQLPESTIVGDIGPAVFPFISAALLSPKKATASEFRSMTSSRMDGALADRKFLATPKRAMFFLGSSCRQFHRCP